jgi:hypothetical protein
VYTQLNKYINEHHVLVLSHSVSVRFYCLIRLALNLFGITFTCSNRIGGLLFIFSDDIIYPQIQCHMPTRDQGSTSKRPSVPVMEQLSIWSIEYLRASGSNPGLQAAILTLLCGFPQPFEKKLDTTLKKAITHSTNSHLTAKKTI